MYDHLKEIMLYIQNIDYQLPNQDFLFEQLSLTVNAQEKIALIGNNGVGKSTLLKLITQEIYPSSGQISTHSIPYYIPQNLNQFDECTIAQVLGIDQKLIALEEILKGSVDENHYMQLNDDWMIEEKSQAALNNWNLPNIALKQPLKQLSGGEKTKVFLAGLHIHHPELIILDEPSNHLDREGRSLLNKFLATSKATILLISHDRELLNRVDKIAELSKNGIQLYGGNFDFYKNQKDQEIQRLYQEVSHSEKTLKQAKEKEIESLHRQQKLNARGKKKQEKAGVSRIMMNTLRNKAEQSSSKLQSVHEEKIDSTKQKLSDLRAAIPEIDQMNFSFLTADMHRGKIVVDAQDINYAYAQNNLWKAALTFQIRVGDRLLIRGLNGSGKTTLVQLILQKIEATAGKLTSQIKNYIYMDQDCSQLNKDCSVYEQAQQYNDSLLPEHEIKIRLHRFLFDQESWNKSVDVLSGGERMRLMLCCMTISNIQTDLIILDEPTNNFDLQNIEILQAAIAAYNGTLLVISHDSNFLEQLRIDQVIDLPTYGR